MNNVDVWRGKADRCYWHAIVAPCPMTRVGALLVASDCHAELAAIEHRQRPPRATAQVIPFVRRPRRGPPANSPATGSTGALISL